jgi:hypothetical protein
MVKVDEGLYGIWKVKSDTDRRNFILVQDGTEDGFKRKDREHEYYVTYFNRGGINRGLENFNAYFSEVEGAKFINLAYVNWGEKEIKERGYVLFKILSVDDSKSNIVISLLDDPELQKLGSSKEVRDRVAKEINNAKLYPEKYELYNVAKGHFTQRQAVERANK